MSRPPAYIGIPMAHVDYIDGKTVRMVSMTVDVQLMVKDLRLFAEAADKLGVYEQTPVELGYQASMRGEPSRITVSVSSVS